MAEIQTKKISELQSLPVLNGNEILPTADPTDQATYGLALSVLRNWALNNSQLTGNPTAPTPVTSSNDVSVATTAFVQSMLSNAGLNPATPTTYGTVRTNQSSSTPTVYLKSEVDSLLAAYLQIADFVSEMRGNWLPVGSVICSAVTSYPINARWLPCNGAAVSRTTYVDLFNAIGTTYGAGNGSTTFNVPNLLGRVPIGAGASAQSGTVRSLGTVGGADTHTLTVNEIPAHTHSVPGQFVTGGGSGANVTVGGGGYSLTGNPLVTSVGGGQAHNNLQPFLALNYFIRF